jgi:cytochrome c551
VICTLALGACGGDDEPAGEQPATGGAGTGGRGAEIFSSTCGTCHTLAAADAEGAVGPNLDDLKPDRDRVLNAIESGPGSMPAGLLKGADAEAVADFVSENAGS